jgi:hypothetical protein
MSEQRLPPATLVAMTSLSLIVIAGIYLAAHLPEHVPLGPAIALVAVAALLLVGNVIALRRARGFAWWRFISVGRWALLAYAVIAGLIEYVFLRDELSGGPLVVLTCALVLFALNVAVLIGFTVARFETEPQAPAEPG